MESITRVDGPMGVVLASLVIATALAAIAVATCAVAATVARVRGLRRPRAAVTRLTAPVAAEAPAAPQLPAGAETALNAITELQPDPRNVVVTHRDPTGEVRLRPYPRSA
jgi:negative regulator of sigma E activity